MTFSLNSDLLPIRRRSRVLNIIILGVFLLIAHYCVFQLYRRQGQQSPIVSDQDQQTQQHQWSDPSSSSPSNQQPSQGPLLDPIDPLRPSQVQQEYWKAKAQALEKQILEMKAKMQTPPTEAVQQQQQQREGDPALMSRPYRIRLEDDPVSMDPSTIPDEIIKAKNARIRQGNARFRNMSVNKQHGGGLNEVIYMQSDRNLEIQPWDEKKPLPKWWEETKQFMAEMEARPNMPPMFDKYLLVDVCIWLGYNNIRYILEMGTHFAELINRTLVFPEYIYMRACDEPELCRLYGTLEDLAYSPADNFPRWTYPMQKIWDFKEIRRRHNVLTTEEFVRVNLVKHGIVVEDPKEWIESRGGEYGAAQPTNIAMAFLDLNHSLTLESHDFLDEWYPWTGGNSMVTVEDLEGLPNRGVPLSRAEMRAKMQAEGLPPNQEPSQLVMHLHSFAYTPDMSLNTTFTQDIPMRWAEDVGHLESNPMVLGGNPVGFKQMYGNLSSDFLHWIEGLHRFAVPPCRFTSEKAMDHYREIVLHHLKLHSDIRAAREYLYANLQARVGGQAYQAVHLRQGDMRDYGWYPDITSEELARNVVYSLWRHRQRGRDGKGGECDSDTRRTKQGEVIWSPDGRSQIAREGEERPVNWDEMVACLDDHFYYATDSNDPSMVEAMRKYGGIYLDELIDEGFLQKHMAVAAFGDLKGIMDQWMMANARHFLGSYMSSLTGGALNQRLEIGKASTTSSFLNFHKNLMQLVDDLYYQSRLASAPKNDRAALIQEYKQRKETRAKTKESPFQGGQGETLL